MANPQTAGYGLTLTAATNVIYYANDFNLETRVQSEDQAHRIGQRHPVLYVDLMTKGTVDVHIVKTLQNKIDLSAKTLGEQARQWLELDPVKVAIRCLSFHISQRDSVVNGIADTGTRHRTQFRVHIQKSDTQFLLGVCCRREIIEPFFLRPTVFTSNNRNSPFEVSAIRSIGPCSINGV